VADPLLADAATAVLKGLKGLLRLVYFPLNIKECIYYTTAQPTHTLQGKKKRKEKTEGEKEKGKWVPSFSFSENVFRVHHSYCQNCTHIVKSKRILIP
jgi:hypothetical protein